MIFFKDFLLIKKIYFKKYIIRYRIVFFKIKLNNLDLNFFYNKLIYFTDLDILFRLSNELFNLFFKNYNIYFLAIYNISK